MSGVRYFALLAGILSETCFNFPGKEACALTEEQFQKAVAQHGDTVYRVAYHSLGSRADAEDVMQSVFLRLLQHRKAFESDDHLKHWLIRVAVNESRRLLRSLWRRRTVPMDGQWDAPVFDRPAQSALYEAVMALPEKYRLTIYLYYYEDYSVKEIAAALRANPSTVQTWLMRARGLLKDQLDPEEGYT